MFSSNLWENTNFFTVDNEGGLTPRGIQDLLRQKTF